MFVFLVTLSFGAWAHESEPRAFVLEDEAALFDDLSLDTDWQPKDSLIQVRFELIPEGGAAVRMEGEADLVWPEAFSLGLTGLAETGELTLDSMISAVTSLRFSIDSYSWESELDRREIELAAEAVFDPFLLEGAKPDVVLVDVQGDGSDLITYEYQVLTGVDVVFECVLTPGATVGFEGVGFWLGDEQAVEQDPVLTVVQDADAQQWVTVDFEGAWSSLFVATVTPTVSVCIDVLGCTELASYDLTFDVVEDEFQQLFAPTELDFPLPDLGVDSTTIDFGRVDLGQLANAPLALEGLGELPSEGTVTLTGAADFTVYPDGFYADAGASDGVVVSFVPGSAGELAATLWIENNDPDLPSVEIPLIGVGVDPNAPADQDTGQSGDGGTEESMPTISGEVKGCGCQTTSKRTMFWFWGALLMLLGVRRR